MVCTTNISPITVMAVVDVVGVIPNTQTSAGLPVLSRHPILLPADYPDFR